MSTNGGACFLCGIGFGIAAGLLFAPRSGARTRMEIRRRARDARGYWLKQTSELGDQVSDQLDRTGRAVRQTAEGIAQAFCAGKQAFTR